MKISDKITHLTKELNHRETGNWTIKRTWLALNKMDLSEIVQKISKEIKWIELSKATLCFGDINGDPVPQWTKHNQLNLIDWVLELNVSEKDFDENLLILDFDILTITESGKKIQFNDVGFVLIDYSQSCLSIIISISLNIFSPKILFFEAQGDSTIELDLGEQNAINNREELRKTLKALKNNLNAEITDWSSDNMNGIEKYGFSDKTCQYRF